MEWKNTYNEKLISLEDAAKLIKSNDVIYSSPCTGDAVDILKAIAERYEELENVRICSAFALYPYDYIINDKYRGHITYTPFFMGPLEKKFFHLGNMDVASITFAQLDTYFREVEKPNIFVADVSLPDEDGYCYFAPTGTATNKVGLELAETKIIQVNKYQHKFRGRDNRIHVSEVDYIVEQDHKLAPLVFPDPTDKESKIASYISELIEDGSILQIGIGGISNAIGYELVDKKDLSVYTEMITESMKTLVEKGAVNGEVHGGFALGTNDLYDFAAKNEKFSVAPVYEVLNIAELIKLKKFISINTCLMVDLTGQVASEGIGTRQVSGCGGALDLVYATAFIEGGKSFTAMSSVSVVNDVPQSNIVFTLPSATPVTIPRQLTHYVVTEYGCVNLRNQPISERVRLLISIAHPDFRDQLRQQAIEAGLLKGE